jgi:hypothetical protein
MGSELWRDLKPIATALKPDAQPEVFHRFAPIDDERYYVPLSETVGSRPLWISPRDDRWADVLWARSAGLVNRHYHPHEVFAYTISGAVFDDSVLGRQAATPAELAWRRLADPDPDQEGVGHAVREGRRDRDLLRRGG